MTDVATVVALLVDDILGEPPEHLHPTVWIGNAISAIEKPALTLRTATAHQAAGLCLALGLPTAVYMISHTILDLMPRRVRLPLEVALLSTTLSLRGLTTAAQAVERELRDGDLVAARVCVGTFVGRDTEDLSEEEVSRAAIESIAENLSDGVTAPMFYGAMFGAPGGLAYKSINTLDSMIGYKQAPYTNLGRASAHLDDLVNFVPARLTALAAAVASGKVSASVRSIQRFAHLTSSPNAGWPEAAFAGSLDIRLGGVNRYQGGIHDGPILGTGEPPRQHDIKRAVKLMRRTCFLLAGIVLLAAGAQRV